MCGGGSFHRNNYLHYLLKKWEEKKEEGKDTLYKRTVNFFKELLEYIFE